MQTGALLIKSVSEFYGQMPGATGRHSTTEPIESKRLTTEGG